MKHALLIFVLSGAAVSSSRAVDLTPTASEYTAEGITFRQLTFPDGKGHVVYEPPRLWTYLATASGLQLTPPKVQFAQAVIQAAPLSAPQPFDQKGMDAARDRFLKTVPSAGQGVAIVSEQRSALLVDNQPAYEVTVTYKTLGETFVRSGLFVNMPDTQLAFSLTSKKSDFDALHKDFVASVMSWHRVDAPRQLQPSS